MGFYKKEGLDVQLVYIASSTTMAQSMFAREVAISTVNSGSVVNSTLQGGDLVLMGAVMNAAAFYIMTRPEIANVQDLRGKKVGVTRLGSSSDFAVREYLQRNKLQPSRDVNIDPIRRHAGIGRGFEQRRDQRRAVVIADVVCRRTTRKPGYRQPR